MIKTSGELKRRGIRVTTSNFNSQGSHLGGLLKNFFGVDGVLFGFAIFIAPC